MRHGVYDFCPNQPYRLYIGFSLPKTGVFTMDLFSMADPQQNSELFMGWFDANAENTTMGCNATAIKKTCGQRMLVNRGKSWL